ncbi:MAG: glycosyltransferase family 9 protein [Planctomycetota bacterium]
MLILRLSALGDVLHSLPALEALRQLWPTARFDWVAESLAASVLEGHPSLCRLLCFPRKRWQARLRHLRQWGAVAEEWQQFYSNLRQERYDLLIDFQGNARSTLLGTTARWRRKITHHRTETQDLARWWPALRPPTPSGNVHRVEKNLHLVRALGWEGSAPPGRLPEFAEERARLQGSGLAPSPVVLHPFVSAFGRFKEWPAQFYVELAIQLAERDWPVVITWARGDHDAAQGIVESCHGAAALAPPSNSLREVAALLTLARAVVAADTGILHLAALAGRPVVGLYGPKDPRRYGPWTPQKRVLRGAVPCSPCTLRQCEHAICMQTIASQAVAHSLAELLKE